MSKLYMGSDLLVEDGMYLDIHSEPQTVSVSLQDAYSQLTTLYNAGNRIIGFALTPASPYMVTGQQSITTGSSTEFNSSYQTMAISDGEATFFNFQSKTADNKFVFAYTNESRATVNIVVQGTLVTCGLTYTTIYSNQLEIFTGQATINDADTVQIFYE